MDSRARQQAAILAIGRRTSAQPTLAVLLRDAVAMTAEVLAADMYGIAQLVDGGGLLKLTVGTASGGGNIADVPDHEGPFSAENSLAGYAMASACPVWTEALPSERRFFDLFLVKRGVVSALAVPLHLGGKPSRRVVCLSSDGSPIRARRRPFRRDGCPFAFGFDRARQSRKRVATNPCPRFHGAGDGAHPRGDTRRQPGDTRHQPAVRRAQRVFARANPQRAVLRYVDRPRGCRYGQVNSSHAHDGRSRRKTSKPR